MPRPNTRTKTGSFFLTTAHFLYEGHAQQSCLHLPSPLPYCAHGSELSESYQDAMKALCFELRRQEIPCQWKACLEVDDEKGLHFHVFILAEAKYKSPCSILNHNSQQWMNVMMQKQGLTYHIAPPHHPMHRSRKGQLLNYATLAGEKLADCIVWISYLAKKRSKSDQMTHIYFGSRIARENLEMLRSRAV